MLRLTSATVCGEAVKFSLMGYLGTLITLRVELGPWCSFSWGAQWKEEAGGRSGDGPCVKRGSHPANLFTCRAPVHVFGAVRHLRVRAGPFWQSVVCVLCAWALVWDFSLCSRVKTWCCQIDSYLLPALYIPKMKGSVSRLF